jgi:hypothetical protein
MTHKLNDDRSAASNLSLPKPELGAIAPFPTNPSFYFCRRDGQNREIMKES